MNPLKEKPQAKPTIEYTKTFPHRQSTLTSNRIIAIHGLNGNPFKTWEKDGVIWFHEFITERLSDFDFRISTFGYNSKIAFGDSTFHVRDYTTQLLNSLHLKRNHVSCARLVRVLSLTGADKVSLTLSGSQ